MIPKDLLKDLEDKGLLHDAVKTYFETGSVERMVEEADREVRVWTREERCTS